MSVLLIDDTPAVRHSLGEYLLRNGLRVREALICELQDESSQARILFTGSGRMAGVVRANSCAGLDYIDLPADHGTLLRALRMVGTDRAEGTAARRSMGVDTAGSEFVAVSASMRSLQERIARIATLDATVLITGESGTGKEVVARELARRGVHGSGDFIPVNCGAIQETLVESELFGHKKGAFTDASTDRKGLVEQAHGGVLFLDEIGEMPISMQVRLLRFLDSGEFRRLGDETTRRAKVRVVAATNRPLEEDISTGRFRLDLFHRLNVVSVRIPPLRERKEDISALAHYCLRQMAARLQTKPRTLSHDAVAVLEEQRWPGNVRELRNVIESAAVFVAGDTITLDDLEAVLTDRHLPRTPVAGGPAVGTGEEMSHVLRRFGGNQTRAAAALGISRTTLWRQQRRLRQQV